MEKFGKFFKKMDESELGVEIMNYSKVVFGKQTLVNSKYFPDEGACT